MVYRYLFRVDCPYHPDRQVQDYGRCLDILRTNRLISQEGVTVLYSEVRLVLGSGHLFRSLNPKETAPFVFERW